MYVIYTIRTWKDHRVKEKAGQCIYRKDIEKIIKRESEEWKNDRNRNQQAYTAARKRQSHYRCDCT